MLQVIAKTSTRRAGRREDAVERILHAAKLHRSARRSPANACQHPPEGTTDPDRVGRPGKPGRARRLRRNRHVLLFGAEPEHL
jgi:hypothetical protein